jgi:hypothetical protein
MMYLLPACGVLTAKPPPVWLAVCCELTATAIIELLPLVEGPLQPATDNNATITSTMMANNFFSVQIPPIDEKINQKSQKAA